MTNPDDGTVTRGSGNVFADLGVAEPEDARIKAELAHAITSLVRARGLSQSDAAEVLGVDQPKVSALARGRLNGFSIERLLRLLRALDLDVEIVVTARQDAPAHTRVRIEAGAREAQHTP